MHTPYRIRSILTLLPLALSLSACLGCDASVDGESILIMSYNLEALFDGDDSGREYDGYSVADGEWSPALYGKRLSSLASAILGAAPGGPDVLVVQEAENPGVLADLAAALGGYPAVVGSPDEEGALGCGILSRWPVVSARAHRARPPEGGPPSAPRYLLEAELDVGGRRLVVFAAHWKSKLGGAGETEPERRAAAALASSLMAERLSADPALAMVFAGDLNENPDEYERVGRAYPTALMDVREAGALGEAGAPGAFDGPGCLYISGDERDAGFDPAGGRPLVMYCPWEDGYSYRYGGEDERIDQLLLSPGLVSGGGALSFREFSAEPPGFLVGPDGVPLGWEALKATGYSDHLPIRVVLSLGS